ncbi:MAG: hypothetical protein EA380_08150 [Phycisphaeraceae bacterium]|nr:MAG: hypothetical protein EA380_08150 [Phycisphaeraceae bacterium]
MVVHAAPDRDSRRGPGAVLWRAMRRIALLALCPVFLTLLPCCAGPERTISGETPYARSFEAAKTVLRDADFELDRVDARAGIITTRPRSSAGLGTPWIDHTETLGDAVSDLMNSDRRIAVVRFLPGDAEGHSFRGDLRQFEGPLVAEVTVERERLYRPNRRTQSTSIRMRSTMIDPSLQDREMMPVFAAPLAADQRLAQRLSWRIEDLAPESVSARASATR